MRVTLLNQYYPPSAAPTGTLLADVAAALAARGIDVVVICSDRDYADPSRRFQTPSAPGGVAVRRVWTTGFGRGGPIGRLLDYATFLIGASYHLVFGRVRVRRTRALSLKRRGRALFQCPII